LAIAGVNFAVGNQLLANIGIQQQSPQNIHLLPMVGGVVAPFGGPAAPIRQNQLAGT
jgi:hypothetical protein